MKFRAVDGDNDWVFGSGLQSYAQNVMAIKYDIQTKLQTFLTECFFDPELGVPWFQLLGAKNKSALVLTLKAKIAEVEGVVGVITLNFELTSEREAKINYLADTIYSTQITGTVNV